MNKEKLENLKNKLKEYAPYALFASGAAVTITMLVKQANRLEHYENGSWSTPFDDEMREEANKENSLIRFEMTNGNPRMFIGQPDQN